VQPKEFNPGVDQSFTQIYMHTFMTGLQPVQGQNGVGQLAGKLAGML